MDVSWKRVLPILTLKRHRSHVSLVRKSTMHTNARTSLTKTVSRSASYRLRSDFVLTSFFKTIRYCKTIVLRKRNVMLFLTATVIGAQYVCTCTCRLQLQCTCKSVLLYGNVFNPEGPSFRVPTPKIQMYMYESK